MPDVTVFISYRRADTSADAGRLYDALRRRFGRDSLFMDVDSLQPGQDWVEVIEAAVSKSDVLLALIGPDWSDVKDDEGNRRLDNEFDRVRLEIEAALKADKAVIPVLFEDAPMPHASELPESLQPLVRRHAIRISHATFDGDLRALLRALKIIGQSKEEAAAEPAATPAAAEPPPPTQTPPPPPPPPPGTYVMPPPASAAAPVAAAQVQAGTAQSAGVDRRILLIGAGVVGAVVLLIAGVAALSRPSPTIAPPTFAPTFAPITPLPTVPASVPPSDFPSVVPTVGPSAGATTSISADPTYGEVILAPAFQPDPQTITVTTSSVVDLSTLGETCTGFAGVAPDYRVRYSASGGDLLRFFVQSDADTTLAINGPTGTWFCGDDEVGLNPMIDFPAPALGRYDIFVGNYDPEPAAAVLTVTGRSDVQPIE